MNIVFVASEAAPFSKTGGLADVVGSLPERLGGLGHHVSVITPKYRTVVRCGRPLEELGVRFGVIVENRLVSAKVWRSVSPGSRVEHYFVDAAAYFDRAGLYGDRNGDYTDNSERFSFFSRAALEVMREVGLRPDVIHLHDWQTALVPLYQKDLYADDPVAGRAATVLTVHNLAYQGVFWHWDMPLLGLGTHRFNMNDLEFYGRINFLKAGLVHADLITTVSPTYALEIQTPEEGCMLEGVLRQRSDDLYGVVNGVDENEWDPAKDALIPANYSAEEPSGKARCKAALLEECGLDPGGAPVMGFIGRLAYQKGPDVLAKAVPDLVERGVRLVVLGEGEPDHVAAFAKLAKAHPGRVAFRPGFDAGLAHRIQAGADMVAMPSRYEPCGLVQLAALKYGTVPVARRTGGLADTIVDATPSALEDGTATGFLFDECAAGALFKATLRALDCYARPGQWRSLRRAGMRSDWSWRTSAKKYEELYRLAAQNREERKP